MIQQGSLLLFMWAGLVGGLIPQQESRSDLTDQERAELNETIKSVFVDQKPVACPIGQTAENIIARYGKRAESHIVKTLEENAAARGGCALTLQAMASRWAVLSKKAEEVLIKVVQDGGDGTREAAWALGSLCSESAVDALVKRADSKNKFEAQACCMALAMIGGEKAKKKLIEIQSDGANRDKTVTQACADGLDLLQKFSLENKKATLLTMLKTDGSFKSTYWGWMGSPAEAALRKAIQWNMKDLVPDLQALVAEHRAKDKDVLASPGFPLRLVYAIHMLGGDLDKEEQKCLKERHYTDN